VVGGLYRVYHGVHDPDHPSMPNLGGEPNEDRIFTEWFIVLSEPYEENHGEWVEVFGLDSKRKRKISLGDKAVVPYSEDNWNEANALVRHQDELVIPFKELALTVVSIRSQVNKVIDILPRQGENQ